ncbi:UNC-like C-terminal-domain-containing protein [Microdochium trichocladiopsis]|uniref:UNC-like C-terminal-domain-containing protein n=1 Tax=Microdochium trichocladiopsis TaxID=1682393 RepID=A0A9P8YBS4_9PEZI|nr:UNC-like C-terminal-domain-containing protein [Microdochium trichocladiopsis]KAH7037816.1 UNC-like C-terminal-domain-containing protein [Microdochium trichocladiopsis]
MDDDDDDDGGDLSTGAFMSFEEWKAMMVAKADDGPDPRHRRVPENRGEASSGDFASLGDEGEINLDFDSFSDRISDFASSANSQGVREEKREEKLEKITYEEGLALVHRSKDAGRTCKERFSYSSFDAGATVLKTSPGTKNPSAILLENKDSYMLLECATENKFFIVELSDDILVDTIVLANYEFFSSMIRSFRVSVSDRYPVKQDKWKVLGTFQARNARDIQPFLVEHPQDWARYLRVEILSHWGNEYYCPLSLLRVHGTRMMDAWKDLDTADIDGDDETTSTPTIEEDSQDPVDVEVVNEVVAEEVEVVNEVVAEEVEVPRSEQDTEPVASPLPVPGKPSTLRDQTTSNSYESSPTTSITTGKNSSGSVTEQATTTSHGQGSVSKGSPSGSTVSKASSPRSQPKSGSSPSASATQRSKASSSGGAPAASPTVQDSFFKAMTKRLQVLESNTTLSMQYIESQSRFLQEALAKLEKRQVAKVDQFLNTLNNTVLNELREVRVQYDEIWQSTVIALETQREQAEREIVALGARVGVLADEVVFQKRMAIVQSILLLICLVLVIFSRGFAGNAAGLISADSAYYPGSPAYPATPKSAYKAAGIASNGRSGLDVPMNTSENDSTPNARLIRAMSNSSQLRQRLGHSQQSMSDVTLNETRTTPYDGQYDREQSTLRPAPPLSRSATGSAPELLSVNIDYYDQLPTPASSREMSPDEGDDVGYDSEPNMAPAQRERLSKGDDVFYYSAANSVADENESAAEGDRLHGSQANGGSGYERGGGSDRRHTPPAVDGAMPNEDFVAPRPVAGGRTTHMHAGSTRKPLPALPEDPD